jgi:hypothetical protein
VKPQEIEEGGVYSYKQTDGLNDFQSVRMVDHVFGKHVAWHEVPVSVVADLLSRPADAQSGVCLKKTFATCALRRLDVKVAE